MPRHAPRLRFALRCAAAWAAIALVGGLCTVARAADPQAPGTAGARISFVAGSSVYVTAGRAEGIAEGDTLEVLRAGRSVGWLVVRYLSSHRASCEPLPGSPAFQVDDEVRYQPHGESAAASGAATPDSSTSSRESALVGGAVAAGGAAAIGSSSSAAPPPGARRARPLRGRISARYLSVDPTDADGFTQPGLDVRLDAARIGGTGVDFALDLRGRRTVESSDTNRTTEARLYRFALSAHDAEERVRITLGRQVSPSLAAISLFDGGLARLDREKWGLGVFAGTEPDPADFAPSGSVFDAGAFYERRNASGDATRWNATGGFVASYDHGNINRHFLFLQAFASRTRWMLHAVQEIDFNLGWKQDMGEDPVSPSSTFLTARYEATRTVDLRAGYDGRRNVLLYEDRETPETEFDDRFRQGAWLGASWRPIPELRVGADGRWNNDGEDNGYETWSGDMEVRQPAWWQSSLRLRATRLTGSQSPGWLFVAGLSARPATPLELGLEAGRRTLDDPFGGEASTAYEWIAARADVLLYRGLYLLVSVERNESPGTEAVQTWSSLSWAF